MSDGKGKQAIMTNLASPKLRIELQFSQEIVIPTSYSSHWNVRFARICCHLSLSDCKTGYIIKQILDHSLSKLHERTCVRRLCNCIRRLRGYLAERFY